MTCEHEPRFGRRSAADAEAAEAYCEAILDARERVARVPGAAFPVVMRRLFERVAWAMTDAEILALASLGGDGAEGEGGEAEPSLPARTAASLPPGAGEKGAGETTAGEGGSDAMGEVHSTLGKFGVRREPVAAAAMPPAERVGLAAAEIAGRERAELERARARLEGDSCAVRMADAMLEHSGRGLHLTRAELAERTGFSPHTVKGILIDMDRAGLIVKRNRRRPGKSGRPEVEYALKPEHCGTTQGTEATR